MATWRLPLPMLVVLFRLKRGDVLIRTDNDVYIWYGTRYTCSGTARAMQLRGLIYQPGFTGKIAVTEHGKNEFNSNKGRDSEIMAYLGSRKLI